MTVEQGIVLSANAFLRSARGSAVLLECQFQRRNNEAKPRAGRSPVGLQRE